MNPIPPTTYYIEEKGWFSSSLKPVTKEEFRAHQFAKRSVQSSLTKVIQGLAIGILATTQTMRVPMRCSVSGAQVALPALGLHLWSQIPTASAGIGMSTPTATKAPPGPQGDEFQVNAYTRDNQDSASVAALAGGGFVVTWASKGQDGSNHGVYGQRYDGAGAKVGSEFPINTYTKNHQLAPSVAELPGGGFVVTWSSHGQEGSADTGIYGQRFDAAGTKVGGEFHVNTYTANNQREPRVAGLTGGGFVVAWTVWDQQDGSGRGIYGQRFDGAGAKVGSEFPINTYTTSHQQVPSVAELPGGSFVVAWQSGGQDGSGYGIYGQRFNGAGAKVGSEFPINTYTAYRQAEASVVALSGGGFVVTWQSDGQDGSDYGVYGQQFDGLGTKVGSEFLINTYTTNYQSNPSVAALAGGGFVVAWESDGQDGSSYGIYGRLFPGNSTSTVQPTTNSRSSARLMRNTPQTQDSEHSQAHNSSGGMPGSSGVTEPVSSTTSSSTRDLSVQTSETGSDHVGSSDQATSQTPLIAGVAAGVAALAYSLLAGGLFYWRRKKADDEPNRAVQLKKGNVTPNADVGHSGSTGEYQILPGAQSHYNEWPKEAPISDANHYHPNINVLNQEMAQEYGDLSSHQQQSDYDIIATSDYRDLPLDAHREMVSARL